MADLSLKIFRKLAKSIMRGHGWTARYRILRFLYNKIFSRIYSFFKKGGQIVRVGEFKMHLDSNDSLGLSIWGVYEKYSSQLAKDKASGSKVAVDIGAHIGYYSLILSRVVSPNGRIISFEPNPQSLTLLKENISLNNIDNIQAEDGAVYKVGNERLKLYLNQENTGDNSLFFREQREFVEVNTISLDDYFGEHTKDVGFIKIDVQGGEWDAFQGMKKILENKDLKIIAEFAPHALRTAGHSPLLLLEFLRDRGFKIFRINEEKLTLDEVTDLKSLVVYLEDGIYKETNIYCEK